MEEFKVPDYNKDQTLRQCVQAALDHYFAHLDGFGASDLYQMVIHEVEKPLLETVMREAGGNQSRAANMLGMSRSTLRKKLAHHGLN